MPNLEKDFVGENILITREYFLDSEISENENGLIKLIFASETPADRYYGKEVLLCRPENVDLTRLMKVGSVLFRHNSDLIVAAIKEIGFSENNKIHILCKFDSDDYSQTIKGKVLSGSLRGVSVGYVINKSIELVRDSDKYLEFSGPNAIIATEWQPWEVSLTPLPVDINSGVVARENKLYEKIENLKKELEIIKNKGGAKMENDNNQVEKKEQIVSETNKTEIKKETGFSREYVEELYSYAQTSGRYKEVLEGLRNGIPKEKIIEGIISSLAQERSESIATKFGREEPTKDSQNISDDTIINCIKN